MSNQLTLNLSTDLFSEIENYMKSARLSRPENAVTALIQYALRLPPYFRDYDWEKAEKEADDQLAAGQTATFDNVDDFLEDLES